MPAAYDIKVFLEAHMCLQFFYAPTKCDGIRQNKSVIISTDSITLKQTALPKSAAERVETMSGIFKNI